MTDNTTRKIFPVILLTSVFLPALCYARPATSNEFISKDKAVYTFGASEAELEPAAGPETSRPASNAMKPVMSNRARARAAAPAATEAPAPAATANPAPAQNASGVLAKAMFSTTNKGQRLLISFNRRPAMKTSRDADGTMNFAFTSAVNFQEPIIPKTYRESFRAVTRKTDARGNTTISVGPEEGRETELSFTTNIIVIDVLTPKKKKPEVKPEEKVEEKKPEVKAEEVKKPDLKPAEVKPVEKPSNGKTTYEKTATGEKFKFIFDKPTPAAVFSRYGYIWLVFDTSEERQIPEEAKKSDLFDASRKIDSADAQIFALTQSQSAEISARKEGNSWLVELSPAAGSNPSRPLSLEDASDAWKVTVPALGRKIELTDDFIGDKLIVFPLLDSGTAFPETIKKDTFTLEKTVQGVVLREQPEMDLSLGEKNVIKLMKKADAVQAAAPAPVAPVVEEVKAATPPAEEPLPVIEEKPAEVKAEPLPEKTEESKVEEKKPEEKVEEIKLPEEKPIAQQGKPLFRFEKWPQLTAAKFEETKRGLQADNYELGKFMFTQQLYAESGNLLYGLKSFQSGFLTAASYFMTGRYQDSSDALERLVITPDLDKNEMLLWQNAANLRLAQSKPSRARDVDMSNFAVPANLSNYPDNIRNQMVFTLTERFVNDKISGKAQSYLNLLPKEGLSPNEESYRKYLQGQIFALQNNRDRAREQWQAVVDANTDRESRAKAQYEIVNLDISTKRLSLAKGIDALNQLRVVWRGDMYEYTLLNRIAQLHQQAGNEIEALRVYKEILSNFPNYPRNSEIAASMQKLFNMSMEKSFSDREKTFDAVSIYYEFEELKPAGEKGDKVVLQLTEALTRFDLLEDAARVLTGYAERRKTPLEKTEAEIRIGVLYFINNQFKNAVEVLRKTTANQDIPAYLKQERDILLARSLIELGDYPGASRVIATLPADMFFRFKTDILWKQKKWAELIESYKYVGEKDERDLMKLAVAYAMMGDDDSLEGLRKSNMSRMKDSEYAQQFDFITDTSNVDYRNLAASLRLPDMEKAVATYKAKIRDGGIGAVAKPVIPTIPAEGADAAPAATPAAPDAANTAPAPAATNPAPVQGDSNIQPPQSEGL